MNVSTPLIDFRGKISPETHVVLEALNRATGRDKSEIAREVLHRFALEQLHAASVMQRLANAEGVSVSPQWQMREDEGQVA